MAVGDGVDFALMVEELTDFIKVLLVIVQLYQEHFVVPRRARQLAAASRRRYSLKERIPDQLSRLSAIIDISDKTCIEHLRMDRNTFGRLCQVLQDAGGLEDDRNVSVSEAVAMFLSVLSHHTKNCIVKGNFIRSGETVSRHVNRVLDVVLSIHTLLAAQPAPIDHTDFNSNWKWFKGCLGALDGTYVKVRVSLTDKPRYRNRRGDTSVNVLGVVEPGLKFVYVLTGWEGSAADSRVLRDAVTRDNGLAIPVGRYYLVDCGYTNGPGFLAPYRGVRYYLKEWGTGTSASQNPKELFNLRHSKARNAVDRSFGILKMRWAAIRSPTYYPIETQNKLIIACCLIHNFIRTSMAVDPSEVEYDAQGTEETVVVEENEEYVDQVHPTNEWTAMRDNLADTMYNEYIGAA